MSVCDKIGAHFERVVAGAGSHDELDDGQAAVVDVSATGVPVRLVRKV